MILGAERSRVLVVEDTEASAEDFVTWLGEAGYATERAAAVSEALAKAEAYDPHVIVLDLQLPSEPGRADEDVENGFRLLRALVSAAPFRPVVILTAHANRELTRRAMQETHGGPFVFKDAERLDQELVKAVAVALANPAYQMSQTVAEFRALVDRNEKEDVYRKFIARHWRVILGPGYRDCKSPYPITRGGDIDILAIRHDGFADLWELKRPQDPLFSSYNQWLHHSNDCARAIGQLMHYYDAAEKETGGGLSYEARHQTPLGLHRPCGFVVIGRYRDPIERERLRLENSFFAGLTLLTYDDLIERAEHFLHFLQQYRNGAAP